MRQDRYGNIVEQPRWYELKIFIKDLSEPLLENVSEYPNLLSVLDNLTRYGYLHTPTKTYYPAHRVNKIEYKELI